MAVQPIRVLIIGAHPDDADIKAGGTASRWCDLGHVVRLVSLTDGRAGHQTMHGPRLALRRRAEAQAAAAVIGAAYEVLDIPDGGLDDRLENRHRLIRLIRGFRPDLILTHRSTDYHPDHRFAGLLVQDASYTHPRKFLHGAALDLARRIRSGWPPVRLSSRGTLAPLALPRPPPPHERTRAGTSWDSYYLLTVPGVCPDTPHLATTPVILHVSDAFKKPGRFEPHVVVDIEDQLDRLVGMLHCYESQFYEWLPYNAGHLDQVPEGDADRREWLAGRIRGRIRPLADRFRDLVVRTYGPEAGERARYIEAFEVSEYGAGLDAEARSRLFPFLPTTRTAGHPGSRKEWVDVPADD